MLSFYSIHPDIPQPMKADSAALGYMPLPAYQYCEAMRVASAMGWYIFPPTDFSLNFDGKEIFVAADGEWRALHSEPLPIDLEAVWRSEIEPDYGPCPSMLTAIPQTGIVQVFTGIFVSSAPGNWCQIRPLVNIHSKSSYWCFEGIVETDQFKPLPLFINLQLTRTESEIFFSKDIPLFQVTCIPQSLMEMNKTCELGSIDSQEFGREGLLETLRRQPGTDLPVGDYGKASRKRRKSNEEG